jgi:hypothetical protein
MRRTGMVTSVAIVVCGIACGSRAKHGEPTIECFDVSVGGNTAGTTNVFESRNCQGGGVTWAAILKALVRRKGSVQAVLDPTPGWLGEVSTLNGSTRFSIDDEGDNARFCTFDRALAGSMRRDYERVNRDEAELKRVMSEAPNWELECFDPGAPRANLPTPSAEPSRPADIVAAERAARRRVSEAIRVHPSWCFAPGDVMHRAGMITFLADGTATHSVAGGKDAHRGRWKLPPEDSSDTRIEVVAGGIFHFDVGESGRLGYVYVSEGAVRRQELTPCERMP